MPVTSEGSERGKRCGAEPAPSEAPSERSEGSKCSGRSAFDRSEASSAGGPWVRCRARGGDPLPSRDHLGTAHLDPPVARVTLAAMQPEAAWPQRIAPGTNGRHRHLFAVWELAVEAQGVQANFRIPFPCPLVVKGGSNLPEG